jgi:16S rRNA (adenine1518-N6/adenine1519-N6)-dimethyltransferase
MGVLTKYLLEKPITTYVIEIDTESVTYLQLFIQNLMDKIISKDFLKYNFNEVFERNLLQSLEIFLTIFLLKLFLKL